MNFTLKPRVFLIGFLPGFLFICGIILTNLHFDFCLTIMQAKNITLIIGIAIIIISFILGQVFDSIRDGIIEKIFEKKSNRDKEKGKENSQDINWDFFFDASEKKIDKLDNAYYLFYVLNIDLSICLFFLMLYLPIEMAFTTCAKNCLTIPNALICAAVYTVSIILLVIDAVVLRDEIVKHTNKSKNEEETTAR